MPIVIRDETANTVVLTIDDSGNMAFGDGTPISLVTIAGNPIIDSNGLIVHGLNSCSAIPTAGVATCGVNNSVAITTISGRTPIVQLDTEYPASSYTFEFRDPDNPNEGGSESVSPLWVTQRHGCLPNAGNFVIACFDEADGILTDPSSPFFDGSLAGAQCGYRWL